MSKTFMRISVALFLTTCSHGRSRHAADAPYDYQCVIDRAEASPALLLLSPGVGSDRVGYWIRTEEEMGYIVTGILVFEAGGIYTSIICRVERNGRMMIAPTTILAQEGIANCVKRLRSCLPKIEKEGDLTPGIHGTLHIVTSVYQGVSRSAATSDVFHKKGSLNAELQSILLILLKNIDPGKLREVKG